MATPVSYTHLHRYKVLTDCGIEGFWNDMNEPALFYSPERLRAFLDSMAQLLSLIHI